QPLLKRRRAIATAEAVGLPADRLHERNFSGHERVTHRILHHLVRVSQLACIGKVTVLEFPDGATNQKVEDDKERKDEEESIHSRSIDEGPQSYETVPSLSR